jgi:putative PIN family toxin of toxin-antitoxin system
MKVVLDTNVFVSGILWEKGSSGKIVNLWKEQELTLVTSTEIIAELVRVLREFKIQLGEETLQQLEQEILKNSVVVRPKTKLSVVVDDPTDNKFIEAAIEGKAQHIITQDKHLLKIERYKSITIFTPDAFLEKRK